MTWRGAAPVLLLTACGGHFDATPRAGAGEGGAIELEQPSNSPVAGAKDAGGSGGAEQGAAGESSATAAGEASAAPAAGPSIRSASRYCDNDSYCFGLSCYAPFGLEQQVCVAGCQSDGDCSAGQQCLSSAHLASGCYATCQTPFDCDYGFDCFDFTNQHQSLVCFPTPWAAIWAAKAP